MKLTLQKRSLHEKKEHKDVQGQEEKNISLEVGSLQGVKDLGIFRAEKETNFLAHLKERRGHGKTRRWQAECQIVQAGSSQSRQGFGWLFFRWNGKPQEQVACVWRYWVMRGCCGEQMEVNKTGSKDNGKGLLHSPGESSVACVGGCKGGVGRQPVIGDGADCEPAIGRPDCLCSGCGEPSTLGIQIDIH